MGETGNNQRPTEALMKKASLMVLVAMSAGMAACSENTTAPRSITSESSDSSISVFGGGATQALTIYDTVRFSITIDPSRNTYYYVGDGNSLNFPAKSLCDVTKSTYGNGEWDKPCTVAIYPVTVNVKAWMDKLGHARVDFDKHLRFVPSSNPANWVNLTFGDFQASLDPFFNILYCATTSGACVDESKHDVTLLTVRNPLTGRITRRIKHFSGYNVAAGVASVTAVATRPTLSSGPGGAQPGGASARKTPRSTAGTTRARFIVDDS
jgi:hypothetical protein